MLPKIVFHWTIFNGHLQTPVTVTNLGAAPLPPSPLHALSIPERMFYVVCCLKKRYVGSVEQFEAGFPHTGSILLLFSQPSL